MSSKTELAMNLKVADEVWISAALLHREQPKREDFTTREILKRAEKENLFGTLRPGVRQHIVQHCVANRPPNPGRYRMLFATGPKTRRLFREGDPSHPARSGAKTTPDPNDIPREYRPLIEWYERKYVPRDGDKERVDPIRKLLGLGRDLWKGIDPDEYVRRLREGWE